MKMFRIRDEDSRDIYLRALRSYLPVMQSAETKADLMPWINDPAALLKMGNPRIIGGYSYMAATFERFLRARFPEEADGVPKPYGYVTLLCRIGYTSAKVAYRDYIRAVERVDRLEKKLAKLQGARSCATIH